MKKRLKRGVIGSYALLRVPTPKLSVRGVLDLWRGSVPAPPKLSTIGKWLNRVLLLSISRFDLIFGFSSPATKLPRTASSGDDAMVGQPIPSTIVDPSSGTGTILTASSSGVNKVVDVSNRDIIVKPACKFGIKGLALRRAPT